MATELCHYIEFWTTSRTIIFRGVQKYTLETQNTHATKEPAAWYSAARSGIAPFSEVVIGHVFMSQIISIYHHVAKKMGWDCYEIAIQEMLNIHSFTDSKGLSFKWSMKHTEKIYMLTWKLVVQQIMCGSTSTISLKAKLLLRRPVNQHKM